MMAGWHCPDCGHLCNDHGGCDCHQKRDADLLNAIMLPPKDKRKRDPDWKPKDEGEKCDAPTPRWLIEHNAKGDLVAWGRVNKKLVFFVSDGEEWKEDSQVRTNEAELGLIHVLRGDGYIIAADPLPCVHDVKVLIGLVEG